jgi:cytoskeletal protein CcmA (bactofilin family)
MARTFVQQSQISGSLEFNDTMAAGSGLAYKQTIVGDLDALRSQINKIIGGERWYDALSGSQDLADIYAALQVSGPDAAFQGDISAVGDVSAVNATFSGDLGAVNATLSGDLGAVNATLSGDLGAVNATLSGDLGAVNGTFSGDLGAVNATLSGDLDAVNGSFSGNVDAVDASFSGAMGVGGIADFAADVYMAAALGVSGSLTVAGHASMNDGLTVSGDRLEVTGSMGITGAVDFDSTLNVDGVADFQSAVYMAAALGVSGSLTVAQDISAVNATLSGDLDAVNGSFSADIDAVNATLSGDLGAVNGTFSGDLDAVNGSFSADIDAVNATLSGNLAAVDATLSGDLAAVSGSFSADLSVGGDLDVAATISADKIKIDSDVATRLYIVDADGSIKDEAKLTFASDTLTVDGDAVFTGDVQVDGDLRVKGAMTYIDTQNMRVQDAFIYLATGSLGTTDSGIVLHGGAGAGMDLVIGQDGGAGEVIFGKGNRAPDGDGAMNDIALVPAWMSEVKLGANEGAMSGSLAFAAGDIKLMASSALKLEAYGEEYSLAADGSRTLWDSQFGASTTLVGAILSLAGGGSYAQDIVAHGAVAAQAAISFSAVGTLRAGVVGTAEEKKALDVYLNGVRLALGLDYSIASTTEVELEMAITADDALFVVVHNPE